MRYSGKRLCVCLLLLASCFLVSRLPFYLQELVGEEGIFAHLFLKEVRKPDYLLISRIDGVELMGAPQHPAPMYLAVNAVGKVVRQAIPFAQMDELQAAFALRLIFSLPLLLLLCAALCYVYRYCRENIHYWLALFLVFATSPVILVSSTELQLDASFGIGVFGLWALAVAFLSRTGAGTRLKCALFFFCNLIAGLGKNEWSLVLLLTFLLTGIYLAATGRSNPRRKEQGTVLLAGVAGLLAGNLASYLYDPLNYVMGFKLMSSMSKNESIFNKAKLLQLMGVISSRWVYVVQNVLLMLGTSYLFLRSLVRTARLDRLALIFTPLAALYFVSLWSEFPPSKVFSFLVPVAVLVLFFAALSASLNREGERPASVPFALMPILFSLLLFGAYFVSTWEVGPRYFAVSLAVSLIALLSVLGEQRGGVQRRVLVTLTLALLALNGVSLLNLGRYNRTISHAPVYPGAAEGACLPVMSSGEAVFKKTDFLGGACSREYFERMSRQYNRPLCGP